MIVLLSQVALIVDPHEASADVYPLTERVSVGTDGHQGTLASSSTSISADGRYVAFLSTHGFDAGGAGTIGVFVRDREAGTTERVSVWTDGSPHSGINNSGIYIDNPSISADGRFVAFDSGASSGPGHNPNWFQHIYVHDRLTRTTERISVSPEGAEPDGWSTSPSISADGRYVAFLSAASNLVPGDTNFVADIFVHDRATGATELASVASDGSQQNAQAELYPTISADGRRIAFTSYASNLAPGDVNGLTDVFVRDRGTGETFLASIGTDGTQAPYAFRPAMSSDGRFVAFGVAFPENPIWTSRQEIWVLDVTTRTTEAAVSQGQGTFPGLPSISADGRHVAFGSEICTFGVVSDVYIVDRLDGSTRIVSAGVDGGGGNGCSLTIGPCCAPHAPPAVSANGRHVAYTSMASNLVEDDTNGVADIFVTDMGPPKPTSPEPVKPDRPVAPVRPSGLCTWDGDTRPLVIGVRGSGEDFDYSAAPPRFGNPIGRVWHKLPTSITEARGTSYGLPYAATAPLTREGARVGVRWTAYFDSVRNGERALNNTLSELARNCPQRPIALIGYSQGAHVIGDTIRSLGTRVTDQIKAIVFIGDPKFNGNASYRHPAGSWFDRWQDGLLRGRPLEELNRFTGRIISLCNQRDPICQSGGDRHRHSANAYESEGHLDVAASFIASRLAAGTIAFGATSERQLAFAAMATETTAAVESPPQVESPRGVEVEIGQNSLVLNWDAAALGHEGFHNCYAIPTDAPEEIVVVGSDGNAASCVIDDLDATRTYELWVIASDGVSMSEPAIIGPVQLLANPDNIGPTARLVAELDDPDANWVVFDGWESSDPDGWIAKVDFDFGDGTTRTGRSPYATVVGHQYESAGTYLVTMTVTDNDGASDTTTVEVTVDVDPPGAPTEVQAVAGDGSATVTWSPAGDDGGSPVLGYYVTASPGDATAFVGAEEGQAPLTQALVQGLENGTKYTFQVHAINAAAEGPASSPSNPVTPTSEPQTVAYTARYDAKQCVGIANFAAGMGLTPEEMIKLGVDGFLGIAEADPDNPYAGDPPTALAPEDVACEYEVTWDAADAEAIETAATWWGVTEDQLHDGGGWLVVVLIYQAIVSASQ